MPKPLIHAQLDSKRFGCEIDDIIKIHEWFDQTKAYMPDMRHRCITHTSLGIFLCTQVFGEYIIAKNSKRISTRDIGESHYLVDYNNKWIPTLQDFLVNMEFQEWMQGKGNGPPSYQKIHQKNVNLVKTVRQLNLD